MNLLLASPAPLLAAGLLYVAMGVAYWRTDQLGMALAFWAYAVANVGFLLAWYEVRG